MTDFNSARLSAIVSGALLALTLAAVPQRTAAAATCAGITMPDRVVIDERPMVLNGMGLRLATIFKFKVYVGSLYLEEPQSDPRSVLETDQPRILTMYFLRNVSGQEIKDALQESLSLNLAYLGERADELTSKMDLLNQMLRDIKKGQQYIFDYLPGVGTTVSLDGVELVTIEGSDFASALFSLWLNNTPNEELRVGLLGGACES